MRGSRRTIQLLSAALGLFGVPGVFADTAPALDPPPAAEAGGATSLELTLVGGAALNPNSQGRASPVVVRIFDLSATSAFESADYPALFEHATDALQHDIVAQEELILRPGDLQERNRPLPPAIKAVGIAAAFRDLEHAVWHVTVAIKPGKRNFVLIDLDRDRIRQDPVDSAPH